MTSAAFTLSPACLNDIDQLVSLENRAFSEDRISRRQFRWMLQRGHCALLTVRTEQALLAGYVLVLFHRGTSLGRIYSLAVAPEQRGQGLARQLLQAAETAALAQDCLALRLEVRSDNRTAIALYHQLGYRQFGLHSDYYADHADALRFQKRIRAQKGALLKPAPYYQQTLPFTCGPASLMMAMHALDSTQAMDRRHELQIWREATSIFMTTGHGGCGPRGLALAAWRRGFRVELWINRDGPLFIHGVRTQVKKSVLELVHQDFKEQMLNTDIQVHEQEVALEALSQSLEAGGKLVMLISSWGFSRQKSPHWIVITAIDDHYVYIHDPEVDSDDDKTLLDTQNVPIPRTHFMRMARFGKEGLRTALALYARSATG